MVWLYPYDGTVFPRGMLAPLVMWNGDATVDAVYLRIKSRAFEYRGVLAPTTQPALSLPFGLSGTVASEALSAIIGDLGTQLPIPQDVWDRAGEQTLGAGDIATHRRPIASRASRTRPRGRARPPPATSSSTAASATS